MPITTITFDADFTLWDIARAIHHALSITLRELRTMLPGTQAEQLTVLELQQTRDEVAQELAESNMLLEEIRLRAFERTLQKIGCNDPELAQYLTNFYLEQRFAADVLYPDVVPVLTNLRTRYQLGLVSNGNTYPERCGLPDTFTFSVFAPRDGLRHKPHPEIYQKVIELANTKPDEILHVGDLLTDDVSGARGVGMRAVWLNRQGKLNMTTIRPDATVASLTELPQVLDRFYLESKNARLKKR
jgi:putative hydrolase of the HAD superfamily